MIWNDEVKAPYILPYENISVTFYTFIKKISVIRIARRWAKYG